MNLYPVRNKDGFIVASRYDHDWGPETDKGITTGVRGVTLSSVVVSALPPESGPVPRGPEGDTSLRLPPRRVQDVITLLERGSLRLDSPLERWSVSSPDTLTSSSVSRH